MYNMEDDHKPNTSFNEDELEGSLFSLFPQPAPQPSSPELDKLTVFKKRDELIRQNIMTCLTALGMGNKVGGEFSTSIEYCINDEYNRRFLENKVVEFVKQLGNHHAS